MSLPPGPSSQPSNLRTSTPPSPAQFDGTASAPFTGPISSNAPTPATTTGSSSHPNTTPTMPSHTQAPAPPKFITTYLPLAGLVTTPILLALPPRKLDLYTLMLFGVFGLSAEEVVYGHYTGGGIGRRWRQKQQQEGAASAPSDAPPPVPLFPTSNALAKRKQKIEEAQSHASGSALGAGLLSGGGMLDRLPMRQSPQQSQDISTRPAQRASSWRWGHDAQRHLSQHQNQAAKSPQKFPAGPSPLPLSSPVPPPPSQSPNTNDDDDDSRKGTLGLLRRIWYGDQYVGRDAGGREGGRRSWKDERQAEEKERRERGEGLWESIAQDVEEAFNGGKKGDEEEEEEE